MADFRSNCYLYFVIMTVNFGLIFEGMFPGWTSPSLPKLLAPDSHIPITPDQSSWIASMLSIGNIATSLFASKIVDILGRQKSLLVTAVPAILSWIIIIFATTHQELYAARFIAGISMGIYHVAAAIYLAEVTPTHMRGMACGMMLPFMILGEFLSFFLGSRLPIRTTAWISLIVPATFICLIPLLPESPYFLCMQSKFQAAEKSLRRLNTTADIAEGLNSIKTTVEMNASNKADLRELFTKRSNLKALGICMSVLSVAGMTGIIAIIFYSQTIFSNIDSSLANSFNYLPLFLRFVGGCICSTLVDRTGKKPLLIFSAIASATCTFIIALFFTLRSQKYDVKLYSWIPVVAICTHSAVVSMGFTTVGNVLVSELFPLNVKAIGNGIYRFTDSFYDMVVSKLFQVVSDNLGIQYSFWGFTFFVLAGVVLIIFVVPETKGKTLEEIQKDLQGVTEEIRKTQTLVAITAQVHSQ